MSHHFWSEEPFSQITILFIKLRQKDCALCVDCWCLTMLDRGVGSYLMLGGQVVMRGAQSTLSGWYRVKWSGKTWVGNCPPCPPISNVPAWLSRPNLVTLRFEHTFALLAFLCTCLRTFIRNTSHEQPTFVFLKLLPWGFLVQSKHLVGST